MSLLSRTRQLRHAVGAGRGGGPQSGDWSWGGGRRRDGRREDRVSDGEQGWGKFTARPQQVQPLLSNGSAGVIR